LQIKTKIVSSYTAGQTGGQQYSDTSLFSIPCLHPILVFGGKAWRRFFSGKLLH